MKKSNLKIFVFILMVSFFSCQRNDMLAISKFFQIQGLRIWLEDKIAYDPATNVVQSWTDNVKGMVLCYKATAPTEFPLVVTLPGGSKALRFVNPNCHLYANALANPINQPFTICTALALDYLSASDMIFNATPFYFSNPGSNTILMLNAGAAGNWDGGTSIQDLNYYCFVVYSGNVDIYRNGIYQTTVSGIGAGGISDFAFGGPMGSFYNFTIGSFMVFDRALGADEVETVYNYQKEYVK